MASSKSTASLVLGVWFCGIVLGFFGGEGSVLNTFMLQKKKKKSVVASRSLVIEAN